MATNHQTREHIHIAASKQDRGTRTEAGNIFTSPLSRIRRVSCKASSTAVRISSFSSAGPTCHPQCTQPTTVAKGQTGRATRVGNVETRAKHLNVLKKNVMEKTFFFQFRTPRHHAKGGWVGVVCGVCREAGQVGVTLLPHVATPLATR